MKTYLITGGAGFIGSNFVRYLFEVEPECKIVNLDRLTYAGNLLNLSDIPDDFNYRFVHGDICDGKLIARLFAEESFDAVVHFAAESHVDRSIDGPSEFIRTNINGTFTLLEEARNWWVEKGKPSRFRFLHVSTDEVYGSLGETGLFSETTAYDPHSPYSASKAASDHLVSSYFHTYGLPVLITNCSNNYGPFQFPEKLIPLMINNALNGKDLPVYGDGKNVRDWLFVLDHCDAIFRVLCRGRTGQTYNVGGNSEKRNIDVVETICDLLDEKVGSMKNGVSRRSLIKFVADRAGHDRRYAIDATKILKELDWKPSVTFNKGISATIDWYLEHSSWVQSVTDGSYQDYYNKMYGNRS